MKKFIGILVVVLIIAAVFYYGDFDQFVVNIVEQIKETSSEEENVYDETGDSDVAIVHYIDVGQGDAILIEIDDYHILIDAGDNAYGDDVVAYLNSIGVDDIEILIGTHPDADHIGGLDDVINSFDVELIIDSCHTHTTQTWNDYQEAIENEVLGGAVSLCDDFLNYEITENIVFEVFDVGDDFTDKNESSVISKLTVYNTVFLFTGDAEHEAESLILEYDINADIYKAGHHGSRSSSSTAFLQVVTPEMVIISAGLDNSYAHPHSEALNRINVYTEEIYGTWMNGSILISADRDGYSLVEEYYKVSSEEVIILGNLEDYIVPEVLTVTKGESAVLNMVGYPNTEYSIVVNLKSGPSSASGIVDKISESDGNVTWTWAVSSRSTAGTYDIIIEEIESKHKWYIEFNIE